MEIDKREHEEMIENVIEANKDMPCLRRKTGRKHIIVLKNTDNVEIRNKDKILKIAEKLYESKILSQIK